jgi:DNA-binding NarL/FixJ family response regulator
MRVLLVEPDPATRDALALLLHSLPDVEIVGEVADGDFALALARTMRPDLVVTALELSVHTGIEITGILRMERPDVRVIGLSTGEPRARVQAMLNAGAMACVSSGDALLTLLTALLRWDAGVRGDGPQ